MINKFGKVMVYVNSPELVSTFWIEKVGFILIERREMSDKILFIELAPNEKTDCHLVLFDRAIVESMDTGVSLGTPSILFGSYDIETMREDLISKGVSVGDIIDMGSRTFNFSDPEGNYFAVEELIK